MSMNDPHSSPWFLPDDDANRRLRQAVHPSGHQNPRPADRYDLVVIGAGTAGLVTAAGAAGLGARVALIEKQAMGGDCLNVGCVPSKALLAASRVAATVRSASHWGVEGPDTAAVDFAKVMQRMRDLRAELSDNDSVERFQKLGIDVFLGSAKFADGGRAILVGDETLNFVRAAICTGARAAIPEIPGLRDAGFLTNETLFQRTELPPRLAVLGGGPIGCEMSQCFARLGSQTTLFQNRPRILPHDDAEGASIVATAMRRDGVELLTETEVVSVRRTDAGVVLTANTKGGAIERTVDAILVSTGRTPNVEGLNLDSAGIDWKPGTGVVVDDRLRTTNRRVFAAGDICSSYKFTHAADFLARIVIQNALFHGRARASELTIPWCTYTSPEIAQVGLTSESAAKKNIDIQTFTQTLKETDRALLDGTTDGFVRIHVKKGGDRIVGATIVAPHAGDLISEICLAMTNGIGLKEIAKTIHPYPTQADAIRRLGDQYNRTRLTPFTKRLLRFLLRFNG